VFRRLLTLSLLVGGCCVAGCGVDSDGSERVRAPLLGGEASGPDDDAVVYLESPGGACSGVLVAPNLVLSAAHCASKTGSWSYFTCTEQGELVNGGTGAGEVGEEHPPEQIRVYTGSAMHELAAHGQQIVATGTTAACRNNLAFVVLDRRVEGVPIAPLRFGRAVHIGELVTAIGYGANDESNTVGLRHRREGIPVVDIGNPPRTFKVDWRLCLGDSGGPALSAETGAVVGVLSLLYDTCSSEFAGGAYTDLAPFRQLAFDAFQAAGADWWLEGEASPSPIGRSEAAAAPLAGGCSLRCSAAPNSLAQVSMLLALSGLMSRGVRRRFSSERKV